MTREEAVAVLKGLMGNPLFNEVHKVAFNIAIHDIKVYRKWDLNELVLTQKENEQKPVLDRIRAEIESQREEVSNKYSEDSVVRAYYIGLNDGLKDARDIIDKYKDKVESEEV